MCCNNIQKIIGGDKKYYMTKTVVSERSGRFEINTQKKFCTIQIDKGIITDETIPKCDYLFALCESNDYYFVELKSSNKINRSFDQICSTINILKPKLKLNKANIHGRVASCSMPSKANQEFRTLKMKFLRDVGSSFEKQNLLKV